METIQKIRANDKMAMIQYLHEKILIISADHFWRPAWRWPGIH